MEEQSIKYCIWNNANKIVSEDLDNIDDLIFKRVYLEADKMLFDIVQEGQARQGRKKYAWGSGDGQIANIISFLGRRGRGKSSAMLSFYAYLEKLQLQSKCGWSEFKKCENGGMNAIKFIQMTCIDAAMLTERESLIDVILAKMWDTFSENKREFSSHMDQGDYEYRVRRVREQFERVREAYLVINRSRQKTEDDIPAASALHELAGSINLKEKLSELIGDYIKLLNYDVNTGHTVPGYLVLAIDDVDMADGNAWEALEQMRRFLSLSKVIIFMTADIDRLKCVCEKCCEKTYLSKDKEGLSCFVSDYLEKVLPLNRRILMPEMSEDQKPIRIEERKNENSGWKWECKCEKEIILELLAKKCGIYFDGEKRRRHFLQNDSLRSLVNYFNEVVNIREEAYVVWLKKDLQERLIEKIKKEEQKLFLKDLIHRDYEEVGDLVINFIRKELRNIENNKELHLWDGSLGQVLYACSLLEAENAESAPFVNCILLFYSIIMRQLKNNQELQERVIGNSVFGVWEYSVLTPTTQVTDYISGFENKAALVFMLTEEIGEMIRGHKAEEAVKKLTKEHKAEILAWLYTMLFVNIEMPVSGSFDFEAKAKGGFFDQKGKNGEDAQESKSDEGAEKAAVSTITVCPLVRAEKGLFGFLYKSLNQYREILQQLLKDCVFTLCDKVFDEAEEMCTHEIKMKIFDEMTYIKDMGLEESESAHLDLLQSTEILYDLGKEIERERANNLGLAKKEKVYEKLSPLYRLIRDKLCRIDRNYKNKVNVETNFEKSFLNRMQTKIFLGESPIPEDVKEKFQETFSSVYWDSDTTVRVYLNK